MWDVCMKLCLCIVCWMEWRMGVMKYIVNGICVIKMNMWEWFYKRKVEEI